MENFLIKKENDSIIYGSIFNLEKDSSIDVENKVDYLNDLDVKNIMIACHGFESNRVGYTIKTLAQGLKDVVVIGFDWPGHNDSDEKLLIKNCMSSYEHVYEYTIRRFPKARVFLFGSSFGGYMTLQFLKKHPECSAEKVFFKSPAIKMEKIFEMIASGEDMSKYSETPYVTPKGVEVYYEFYKEMLDIKITPENIVSKPEIYIFHGTDDKLSLYEDILEYNKDNIHVQAFEGVEHGFRGDYFQKMVDGINKEINATS
ncbi:MAG: alpha/beta fold hydrolase [Clostridia bacterium]|nr:alpha/beta fold hydrolase [Clostridia bacterium]